jgi:uncharacterized protein YciI
MQPQSLFAVIRVRGVRWRADRQMREQQAWQEHAAFMNGLAESRFIVRGGPLGAGERVLHIVEAESEEAIRERLAQDPWETMGILRTESVEPWQVLLDRDAQSRPRASIPSKVGKEESV